jgi:hypothetical protein
VSLGVLHRVVLQPQGATRSYWLNFVQEASCTHRDDATSGHAAGDTAAASRLLAQLDQLVISEPVRTQWIRYFRRDGGDGVASRSCRR